MLPTNQIITTPRGLGLASWLMLFLTLLLLQSHLHTVAGSPLPVPLAAAARGLSITKSPLQPSSKIITARITTESLPYDRQQEEQQRSENGLLTISPPITTTTAATAINHIRLGARAALTKRKTIPTATKLVIGAISGIVGGILIGLACGAVAVWGVLPWSCRSCCCCGSRRRKDAAKERLVEKSKLPAPDTMHVALPLGAPVLMGGQPGLAGVVSDESGGLYEERDYRDRNAQREKAELYQTPSYPRGYV